MIRRNLAGAGRLFQIGYESAIIESDDIRAVREARQDIRFIAEGAVFPAHITVAIQMFRSHHFEGDIIALAQINGIKHPRVMPQGEGIDEIIQLIQFGESRHRVSS